MQFRGLGFLFGVTLILCTGCITVKHSGESKSVRIVGKAKASLVCTSTFENGVKVKEICDTKAQGDGLTEGAVSIFTDLLKVPGAAFRGVGAGLP